MPQNLDIYLENATVSIDFLRLVNWGSEIHICFVCVEQFMIYHVIVHCKYINLSDINFAYRGEIIVCMVSACLSKMNSHSIEFE